jgi:hypothetical protein
MSKIEVSAIVIAVLIAIAGIAYFAVYDKHTNTFGVTITVQIYGYFENGTSPALPASYDPLNFTISQGAHLTLNVQNTDNKTQGLAIPSFNLDTGAIPPNGTARLSLVANTPGNYTFDESSSDCGGTCPANQAMNGWFLVESS